MKDHFDKILGLQNKASPVEELATVPLEKIRTNPYQPRETIDQEKIEELAQSIRTYGLLQPVILTAVQDEYFLVAGERRYLACKKLGWQGIPALIRNYQHSSMATVALIENLQRENLNYLEEAEGYKRLMETFKLTQEVLAQRLGKSQSAIANKLRLLKLPGEIKELIKEGKLSERHARALLKLDAAAQQIEAAGHILQKDLKVREAELLVEEMQNISVSSQQGTDGFKTGCKPGKRRGKVIVRDARIFLNTVRQAMQEVRRAGLQPQLTETEHEDCWEVLIRLPKTGRSKRGSQG